MAGAAWTCKEANPARIFIEANDKDLGGTLNRAEREKAVAPKNIKLKFTAQGAAWTAEFDELDTDKNGELDVLKLRGYEPADYVKAHARTGMRKLDVMPGECGRFWHKIRNKMARSALNLSRRHGSDNNAHEF